MHFLLRLSLVVLLSYSALVAQSLLEQDLMYGLNLHNRITSVAPVIDQDEARARLESVFSLLVSTPSVKAGPVPRYQLFYVHNPAVNAFSTAGGRMYVTDAFMKAV